MGSDHSAPETSERQLRPISLAEVMKHTSSDSLWTVVNGKVVDITHYVEKHPGGKGILAKMAGKDASEQFEAFHHSEGARKIALDLAIGNYDPVSDGDEQKQLDANGSTAQPAEKEPGGEGGKGKRKEKAKKDDFRRVKILYGSQRGQGKRYAEGLAKTLDCKAVSMDAFDPEDLPTLKTVVLICSTYTDGSPPKSGKFFIQWLSDSLHDWRVDKKILSSTKFAVFGLGNSVYTDHFNSAAKTLESCLCGLGAQKIYPSGVADANVAREKSGDSDSGFKDWAQGLLDHLRAPNKMKSLPKAQIDNKEQKQENPDEGLVDLEDLGAVMAKSKKDAKEGPREMLTESLRKSLTKQGYKLIGSHSGVKLCRWTKAMLRGRGGCYKHSFYGISSYQCMETTPSLACANKCVFCWRHHSNPVGKSWKWKMDDAKLIVNGAIEKHQKMIKQMKGVPGVKPERYKEAFTVKHCALSLVGEPIMYPQINEFLGLLHEKKISSFLVTNAQFPDRVKHLNPCTQLYVSIDAATKDTLKAVDRPLHKDFWERFIGSLKALKQKASTRTVYRLTLVRDWNMQDVKAYVKLLVLGLPLLIEIKGVTFCGDSKASSLTIKNSPFHHEVCTFGQSICDEYAAMFPDAPNKYQLACEHEHSNCILLADTKLKVDGKWQTWINYEKFHSLYQEWKETGKEFTAFDYMAATPSWAVYGAAEQGFDPKEERVRKKGKKAKQKRLEEAKIAAAQQSNIIGVVS
ncbi:hypothetical protein AAMO2058_001168800 [Amorphochlora amoebiformis]